ncbi:MAG TPA: MtaA/CmuA family methyltransferase [Nitrospirae bacterium]|nr:MtaA/CmuA family methyltransferase [Nitrospirota bacterium]HDZ88153.1 MtaA/CmuA family methyltransferase [Nitrospirota bacterium]
MSSRERVLKLFRGEETDRPACFSGMGNATTEGLNQLGYKFAQVHLDARQMAETAVTTPKLFGFDSCVLPFDLCVEAEALGCRINTYAYSGDLLYPTIKEKVIHNEAGMEIAVPDDLLERGRIPMMMEAIGLAKKEIGDEVPVGSYLLGPFTLAGQIMELNDLLKLSFKKPDKVGKLLDTLAGVIIAIAAEYEKAGVDYLTIREMGATSDVLSPRGFKNLILPHLKKIFEKITVPSVVHICGKTNDIAAFMIESGTNAISVDQKNDVAETRKKLGDKALIFGNYDPYNVLVSGTTELVRETVRKCLDDGVSAVWPGCDIWPTVPPENFRAMIDEVKEYRR